MCVNTWELCLSGPSWALSSDYTAFRNSTLGTKQKFLENHVTDRMSKRKSIDASTNQEHHQAS